MSQVELEIKQVMKRFQELEKTEAKQRHYRVLSGVQKTKQFGVTGQLNVPYE